MTDIVDLAAQIRASRGLSHKADIAPVMAALGIGSDDTVPVGDDAAAIPDGEGHLLLAIEGFVEDFIAADPWFAGYCGVMVNVSDILAMGGRPIAVVDAFWAKDEATAIPMLSGMRAAAQRYGVPVVGGHSNLKANGGQLAVAILGRTEQVVTSFGARPGDNLLIATDMAGRFREPFPWWDASTNAGDAHLRELMPVMPDLAAQGRLTAAKDISMAGPIGTAIMLAEASRVGLSIDLDAVPRPAGIDWDRWASAFPSFGFVMTARPENVAAVVGRFAAAGVACAPCGTVTASPDVSITSQGERALVWSAAERLIGCHSVPETFHA
ncbi:sll0787 family AIR synthase-like protein [Novosphingobium sp. PP1Y]|uniref:sll0787 family AIR synthase-like protein n=1 Tax=Novosphingobium sp. PP1Y TaxID=702113 RepID=UPI00020EFA0B|nr:sll0787 family AIR synthase-like protein [Novosphingobium sp. PP1Y]CCA90705.1 conserved hypothetical protein [Novosphingobium sp. PP1Y]